MTSFLKSSSLLKLALLGDAAASGMTGLLMAGGAAVLTGLLGVPQDLLLYAGLFLIPYAAFVAFIGMRPVTPRGAVWLIIAANVLWSIESIALLGTGWVSPTALGVAFILFQALVVLGFAIAQFAGLRRERFAAA